jgi:hypothetical protein
VALILDCGFFGWLEERADDFATFMRQPGA